MSILNDPVHRDDPASLSPPPRYARHAVSRIRQRGRNRKDIDLILRHGTPVDGNGILLRDDDVKRVTQELLSQIHQLNRLAGWKVIIEGETIVTVYRTRRAHQKRLLRKR